MPFHSQKLEIRQQRISSIYGYDYNTNLDESTLARSASMKNLKRMEIGHFATPAILKIISHNVDTLEKESYEIILRKNQCY